jgi:hypothetical protein
VELLEAHAAATWALVGLIWVVQLVVYPSFERVGAREFPAYHAEHTRRMTWIVAPLMGVELVTGLALLTKTPPGVSATLLYCATALLLLNWAWTALVAVPLHARVTGASRAQAQARLVATNWVRTWSWSVRGALVAVMLT